MLQQLKQAALDAQSHAYAPYSKFKVGAALIANNDKIYRGCNVENAAFPQGQCAEASAIGTMVTEGATRITKVLIVSPNEDYCYPCGGCRQKLAEFASADTEVHLMTSEGDCTQTTVGELLPHNYTLPDEDHRG